MVQVNVVLEPYSSYYNYLICNCCVFPSGPGNFTIKTKETDPSITSSKWKGYCDPTDYKTTQCTARSRTDYVGSTRVVVLLHSTPLPTIPLLQCGRVRLLLDNTDTHLTPTPSFFLTYFPPFALLGSSRPLNFKKFDSKWKRFNTNHWHKCPNLDICRVHVWQSITKLLLSYRLLKLKSQIRTWSTAIQNKFWPVHSTSHLWTWRVCENITHHTVYNGRKSKNFTNGWRSSIEQSSNIRFRTNSRLYLGN